MKTINTLTQLLMLTYMKNLKFIYPIVFNISKIKKVCKRIGQMHFHLQLEDQVLEIKFFGRITKATMLHYATYDI